MDVTGENPPAEGGGRVSVATPVRLRTSSSAAPSLSAGMGRAYERFLKMPIAFVVVALWLAGAALVCSCVLVVYWVASALI